MSEILKFLIPASAIGLMIFSAWSFHKVTKKSEYHELLNRGQKINLNLVTLWSAWLRKDSDPLKPVHKKNARIGFRYFLGMFFGIIAIFCLAGF